MDSDDSSNIDPTAVLTSARAAVQLVSTVLKVAPKIKTALDNSKALNPGSPGADVDVTGVSTTSRAEHSVGSLAKARVDPERERRAYETVNYVLKTVGSRLLEADLVDTQALARGLTAATSHIEVKLFSLETNRLFQSLAPKLNDVKLVNSVFASIYFIGFLTAEISSSLPNYKDKYVPIGPRIIQQICKVAIGEDAFRENITATLDACTVLARTAGLLRPTDIGYTIFPGLCIRLLLSWSLPANSDRFPVIFPKSLFQQILHGQTTAQKYIRETDQAF